MVGAAFLTLLAAALFLANQKQNLSAAALASCCVLLVLVDLGSSTGYYYIHERDKTNAVFLRRLTDEARVNAAVAQLIYAARNEAGLWSQAGISNGVEPYRGPYRAACRSAISTTDALSRLTAIRKTSQERSFRILRSSTATKSSHCPV